MPKVNELLRAEVGAIIQRELEMPKGVIVAITRAKTEPDLKAARLFIRVYPEDHSLGALDYLRKNAGALQRALNHRLAMRFVPAISFSLDKETDETLSPEEEVEKILDSLKTQNEESRVKQ
ncbi:ribosome-binding factor A [Candidatus Uhrbacteria bacterium]|nr:ribosome-binding factor A [Candidatus Uhrbacteria bacterium]